MPQVFILFGNMAKIEDAEIRRLVFRILF